MIYVYAFLVCGIICMIGEIILEYTNLTPAHVNAILVVSGAVLAFFGIYEELIRIGGAGASVPITNFGYLLFKGAYEGFLEDGFTGLLNKILSTSSGGLSATIVIAFFVSAIAKPKN